MLRPSAYYQRIVTTMPGLPLRSSFQSNRANTSLPRYLTSLNGSGPRLTESVTPYTYLNGRSKPANLPSDQRVGGPPSRTFRSTTAPTAQVLVHQAKQHSAHTQSTSPRAHGHERVHMSKLNAHTSRFLASLHGLLHLPAKDPSALSPFSGSSRYRIAVRYSLDATLQDVP